MAVCRGATAIGYFTHVWKPAYRQFGVPKPNRKELARINAQITRLAPAILSSRPRPAVRISAEPAVKLDAMATAHAGRLYVFAVNYDQRAVEAQATVELEGIPEGAEIEVVDESRTIRARAGSFTDRFEPLAVHVYRVETPE